MTGIQPFSVIETSLNIHYHGTPICPKKFYHYLTDCCFCVSFYYGKNEIKNLPKDTKSIMLDNGAFSAYTKKAEVDWKDYYLWCEQSLRGERDWCVVPDIIDGNERDQDTLLNSFPKHLPGAPVWHLNEDVYRLKRLCNEYERVCIGSSGKFWNVGGSLWKLRMDEAFEAIIDKEGSPTNKLHMLRGMSVIDQYPFASADSTNLARNFSNNAKSDEEQLDKILKMRKSIESKFPAPQYKAKQYSFFSTKDLGL